jgi:hypothetical protein
MARVMTNLQPPESILLKMDGKRLLIPFRGLLLGRAGSRRFEFGGNCLNVETVHAVPI